jgi:hypothetical protein
MEWRIGVACGIAAGVVAVCILLSYVMVYCWTAKTKELKKRPGHIEFQSPRDLE